MNKRRSTKLKSKTIGLEKEEKMEGKSKKEKERSMIRQKREANIKKDVGKGNEKEAE